MTERNLDDLFASMTQPPPSARTRPLADRIREAADTIEQWNAMCGMPRNHFVTPNYLRDAADKL